MWVKYNPNPAGRFVGDCAVRAVAAALDVDWEEAYNLIADAGYAMGDMPSSDSVWGAVLRRHGFYRAAIPNTCPDCYTVDDFIKDYPKGVYVLRSGGMFGHVATIRDGVLMDSWDSRSEVPVYYWYKK